MLEAFGYTVEDRVLCAADYGDPTTRERLFVVASRTKRPTYPEPTHAEDPGPESDRKPWRTAREIMDWPDLGGSIFNRDLENPRVQPLSKNMVARIVEGIRRHCDSRLEPLADAFAEIGPDELEEPFLVATGGLAVLETDGGSKGGELFCLRQQSGGVLLSVETPTSTVSTRDNIGLGPTPRSVVKPRN